MSFPIGPFRRVASGGSAKLPAFLPLQYQHLELYLDSRVGVTGNTNGAPVTSWLDQSGGNHTFSQGVATNQPSYVSVGSPTGKPAVRFSPVAGGANQDWMQSASWTPSAPPSTRGYTFYAVLKSTIKGNPPFANIECNQAVFGPAAGDTSYIGAQVDVVSPAKYLGWRDTVSGNLHGTALTSDFSTKWVCLCWKFPPPSNNTVPGQTFINGVLQTPALGVANHQIGLGGNLSRQLGIQNSNSNFGFQGDMGAFVWFSDNHSLATISLFSIWADVFFGLT